MKIILTLLLSLIAPLLSEEPNRNPSPPFISGDTFRAVCSQALDDDSRTLDPDLVKENDLIFVRGNQEWLGRFFSEYHPKIKHPYRLISSNADDPAPGPFASYLDEPLLLKWFAVNLENCTHPKMHPLPLGIPNQCLPFGHYETFLSLAPLRENSNRPHPAYMNFSAWTFPSERTFVYQLLSPYAWCFKAERKPLADYLTDLSQSQFVLSPRGMGLDCYRTWEALLMGAIPIVKSSDLDPLFEDLPVLIIQDWRQITPKFLKKKRKEFQKKSFRLEKMYADYWIRGL